MKIRALEKMLLFGRDILEMVSYDHFNVFRRCNRTSDTLQRTEVSLVE